MYYEKGHKNKERGYKIKEAYCLKIQQITKISTLEKKGVKSLLIKKSRFKL